LLDLSLHHDYCSQIAFIPFMTALLVYWDRRRIFAETTRNFAGGALLVVLGLLARGLATLCSSSLGNYDALSVDGLAIVLVWAGGFLALFGTRVFRAALYPVGLLCLMIPIPGYILSRAIFYLQAGSTAVTVMLFHLAGVPVFREGFILAVPGLTIEVARSAAASGQAWRC
jgi:exosortase